MSIFNKIKNAFSKSKWPTDLLDPRWYETDLWQEEEEYDAAWLACTKQERHVFPHELVNLVHGPGNISPAKIYEIKSANEISVLPARMIGRNQFSFTPHPEEVPTNDKRVTRDFFWSDYTNRWEHVDLRECYQPHEYDSKRTMSLDFGPPIFALFMPYYLCSYGPAIMLDY